MIRSASHLFGHAPQGCSAQAEQLTALARWLLALLALPGGFILTGLIVFVAVTVLERRARRRAARRARVS